MTDYRAEAPSKASDQLGFRPKRFWKAAAAVTVADGHEVHLDGRPVKTPSGATLIVPTSSLAHAVAAEWQAVGSHVEFGDMPLTRLAFAAVDRLAAKRDDVVAEALRYAETDLLCYPSEYPEALQAREDAAWLPVLEWAHTELGLRFEQNLTLIHTPQPQGTLDRLGGMIAAMTPYEQAGLMAATPLFGSVILALAVWQGRLSGTDAFAASRVGEDFQAGIWGRDAEAEQRASELRANAVSIDAWFRGLV
jgi:chaperone required for assembly of F1-ATPase